MPYRSVTVAGVTLLCFPPHDLAFADVATRRLAALDRPDAEALQETLRATFPEAVVRPREKIATLGAGAAWYAYRDGRYSPYDDSRWWEEPGVARITIDADGRCIEANAVALELIGIDRETLLSMRSGDLADPDTHATAPWVCALVMDTGELHATAVMVTPTGKRIPIEYHLTREGADRYVSSLRIVPQGAVEPSEPEVPAEVR